MSEQTRNRDILVGVYAEQNQLLQGQIREIGQISEAANVTGICQKTESLAQALQGSLQEEKKLKETFTTVSNLLEGGTHE